MCFVEVTEVSNLEYQILMSSLFEYKWMFVLNLKKFPQVDIRLAQEVQPESQGLGEKKNPVHFKSLILSQERFMNPHDEALGSLWADQQADRSSLVSS